MMSLRKEAPIGVFDSGVGGISVLKELIRQMPGEDFLFFGDSRHAPFGSKTPEEVLALTQEALLSFRERGCKGMVIACNTATAAAADTLRSRFPDFPVIAIEPALKPAVEENRGGNVLLMATPLTLKTDRVEALQHRFDELAAITSLPCYGLVELIETGHWEDEVIHAHLTSLFAPLSFIPDAVVLGCTHYPHIQKAIAAHFPPSTRFYDGGAGTARQCRHLLEEKGLLRDRGEGGTVEIETGIEETCRLAKLLFHRAE